MSAECVIYRIQNRRNGKCYFGYGLPKRPYKHFKDAKRTRKKGDSLVTNAMRREGSEEFELTILLTGLTEQEAKDCEVTMIAERRTNVCRYGWAAGYNRTDGGEGTSGHRHSESKKAQWSHERKGKPSWSKGAKFSPEHRANIAKAKLGNVPKNKGQKAAPETLARMSIARKGKPQPNISAAKKGKSNGHEGLPSPLKGKRSPAVALVQNNLSMVHLLIQCGFHRYELAKYFDISGSSLDKLFQNDRQVFSCIVAK